MGQFMTNPLAAARDDNDGDATKIQ